MEHDLNDFDCFLYAKMSESKLPGLTVSIIENNEIIHSRAFGLKNIESAEPTTVRSNYWIGSVTKSFVALAIAKLVDERKISFHDPITKYLPLDKYKAFKKVELHHLLSHSSGIPGLGSAEVLVENAVGTSKKWFPVSSLEDIVCFLDQVDSWADAEPGKKFFYLNEGYLLLGEVVSRVSGKTYEKFIQEEILSPLEMNRSFFSKAQVERDWDWAAPYLIKEGKAVPAVAPYGSGAAGGLMSNVFDLSNYLLMYLNRGEFRGKRIVNKETLETMETIHSRPPLKLFPDYGYGYGLFVTNNFFGQKLVRHDGSLGVYTSSIAYLPESGIAVTILSNAEGYKMNLFAVYGMMVLLGKDPKALLP